MSRQAETGQALGCQLGTERPGDQGPDEREQQAHGTSQVGVGEAEEVRVVGALNADERRGVDQRQQHAQVKLRLDRQGADADERYGKRQHQHREIMQVGQHQKQVKAGEYHRHRRPEKESVDLRCRVVHRGEEAARHCRQDHCAAAVGPAQQNPQHRGDNDRRDGGSGGIQHQPAIQKRGQPPQAPVPIDRAPAVLAFALDRVLQAATVLPQIDPLAETINRVGEQQLLAIIQRFGAGLAALRVDL